MADLDAPPPRDRTHQAAKRYIYAWGGGDAEGDAHDARPARRQGRRARRDDERRACRSPPGFTITTEACNDYFAAGEQLPDGLWDDVLEAVQEVERADRQGLRRPGRTRSS